MSLQPLWRLSVALQIYNSNYDHIFEQVAAFKPVMQTQINAAWFDLYGNVKVLQDIWLFCCWPVLHRSRPDKVLEKVHVNPFFWLWGSDCLCSWWLRVSSAANKMIYVSYAANQECRAWMVPEIVVQPQAVIFLFIIVFFFSHCITLSKIPKPRRVQKTAELLNCIYNSLGEYIFKMSVHYDHYFVFCLLQFDGQKLEGEAVNAVIQAIDDLHLLKKKRNRSQNGSVILEKYFTFTTATGEKSSSDPESKSKITFCFKGWLMCCKRKEFGQFPSKSPLHSPSPRVCL